MFPPLMEMVSKLTSTIAGLMVAYAMFQNYFPYQLRGPIKRYSQKLINFFYPYIQITFNEYNGDGFQRSKSYAAIERYLNANSSQQAKRLQATVVPDTEAVVLTMAKHEEVTDEFAGIKLWWSSNETPPNKQSISYPREDGKRYFNLTFHRKHRDEIRDSYLKHVLDEGKAITVKERRRKLYTNNKVGGGGGGGYRYGQRLWSSVIFEHPASFDTLAMDPMKKNEIMDDLVNFSESKDYYAKIGKAWKRGYLLFGPPGTGKSTMIAAMANLLNYDVYDLELTSVMDNTELRKLLIDTSSKSIIVIEDIDCSLDLTGQRAKADEDEDTKKKKKKDEDDKEAVKEEMKKMGVKKTSEVTLSGLLNFIDGLWSSCGGERIIVFTTNYKEKLDPALIRRGRMDKHVELSYCGFEAFKILAKNYMSIDSHEMFTTIERMLGETNMTPADVAENLMPKSRGEGVEPRLKRLAEAIEEAKEEAKRKAEEEEKTKAQKLAKEEEEKKAKAEKLAKEEEEKKAKEKESGTNQELGNGVQENGDAIKGTKNGAIKENGVTTM